MGIRSIAALALALLLGSSLHAAEPAVGDAPPDFLGRTKQGDEVRLASLRGKLVVVSFWASWCEPCRKELPILENLQRAAGPARIAVVAVNVDEKLADYKRILTALGQATITLTRDEHDQISKSYGVKVIPHMVLIGRDGRVAHVHKGYDDQLIDNLVEEVNGMLGEPPESTNATPP